MNITVVPLLVAPPVALAVELVAVVVLVGPFAAIALMYSLDWSEKGVGPADQGFVAWDFLEIPIGRVIGLSG